MGRTKKRIKIKFIYKLLMGFGILCIIIGVILILGDKTIKSTFDLLHTVINEQVRALAKINQLHYRANQIRLLEVELFENNDYYTAIGEIDNLNGLIELLEKDLRNFVSTSIPKEDKNIGSLLSSWELYRKGVEQSLQHAKSMNMSEAEQVSRYSSFPRFQVFSRELELISTKIEERTQQGYDDSIVELKMRRHVFLLISIIGITGGVAAAFVLSRSLSSRVLVLRAGALRLANGDMKTPIPIEGNDELTDLATSFNEMTGKLQRTTTSVDNLNREITERKRVEGKLRKAEEKYRRLFEGALDAIFVADAETGIIVDCNPAAAKLVGRAREELIGQHQRIPHPPEDIEGEFSRTFKEHLEEKAEQVLETQIITAKGQIRDVAIKASLLEISGKKVLQGIFRDITEKRKAEEIMKRLNQKLEDTVTELKEANQGMKDFIYIASHDLREPLRKVTAFGAMLQQSLKDKLSGDDLENLQFMIDGAQRMTQMIEGLLVYSRVSTQAQLPQSVDLNEIVMQVQQLELAVLIEEEQVTIEAQSLPTVEVDPVQIRQLMQNLIANGIKYQKKGNVPHIIITSKPAAEGMVRIEVTDNGIGIAPEYLQSIFTMFRRLHSRDEYEGTGIGLAVCKKIVERHGGRIGVESEPDKGSTFWFTIPMAEKLATAATEVKSNV